MQTKKDDLTPAKKLHEWLYSLPRRDFGKAKKLVCRECFVKMTTLDSWLYGKSVMPMRARRDINRLTQELSGYELFTITYEEP